MTCWDRGHPSEIDPQTLAFRSYWDYYGTLPKNVSHTAHPKIDGAYDKVLVRLGGLPMPLRLLSPYEGLPMSVYEECRRVLHEKYPDWVEPS